MEQNGTEWNSPKIPHKFPFRQALRQSKGKPRSPGRGPRGPRGPGALAPRRGASGATDESAAAGGGGEGPGAQTGHRLTHGEPGGSSIGRHQIR